MQYVSNKELGVMNEELISIMGKGRHILQDKVTFTEGR